MPTRARAALAGLALALVAGLGVLAWVALRGGAGSRAVTARAEVETRPVAAEQARGLAGIEGDAAREGSDAASTALDPRVALGAESPDEGEPWRGVVLEAAGGSGIAEAEVELSAGERVRAALTDEQGRFELNWPRDLPARLAIRHPRYVDATASRAPLDVEGRFTLERSAALRGHVQPAGVEGVVAAWLQATSSTRYWQAHEVPIAADGRFAFEDLTPGEYLLAARVAEHAVAPEAGLRLDPGQELELLLRARAGARVLGSVRSAPGNAPLAGLRVVVEPQNDDLPRDWRRDASLETTSDGGGRFELAGLGPGTWRVSAFDAHGGRTSREVEVAASGERVEVELTLDSVASVGGRVVDASGAGVAGCEVAASRRSSSAGEFVVGRGEAQAVSDAQGFFRIEGVAPGRGVQVAARTPAAEGERPERSAIQRLDELEPGASRSDLLLTLGATSTLVGRVVSGEGAAIAGARVTVLVRHDTRTTSSARGTSDAGGRFEIDGLPGAGGYVYAEAEGWRRDGTATRFDGSEVVIELSPAFAIEGYAIDAQGLAVVGVPITTQPVPDEGDERSARRERESTSTDENGRFRFEDLRPGPWMVRGGSYAWRVVGEEWTTVELPQLLPLELVFERNERPARATIEGEVVLAGGGAPTGLELEGLRGGVLTVERGRFRVTGVTPTRQRLTVRADGHARAPLDPFDLAPGGLFDVGRVELAPSTHLTVRVREKDGGDLSGARVSLQPLPVEDGGTGKGTPTLRLDARRRGRYETTDATRHAWRLVVDRSGYARHTQRVEVREQARQSLTVELESRP